MSSISKGYYRNPISAHDASVFRHLVELQDVMVFGQPPELMGELVAESIRLTAEEFDLSTARVRYIASKGVEEDWIDRLGMARRW